MPIFVVFGLTQSRIEPESTAFVADALSTWPLIVLIIIQDDFFSTASNYQLNEDTLQALDFTQQDGDENLVYCTY